MLHLCEHIFVQTKDSLTLLAEVGVHNASYAGDTRFDRVLAVAASANALPQLADFAQGQTVIVAGSTWTPDEKLLADLVNNTSGLKLIVVPHEVSESGVRHTLSLIQKPSITYSAWQKNPTVSLADYSVFVVDAVGFLSSLYRFGTIAYVGGGFGVGIHNTLEAAVYGIPVIFGANYRNFAEAVDLVTLGGAYAVSSLPELQRVISSLRSNRALYKRSCDSCKRYVQQHGGATEVVMQKIFK
jgi:3-deoxy-D-manno-octulosonic-acid transferase